VTARVGLGFDVHAFSDDPGRKLVLGGVEVEGRGLAGHSDADVVAHAVADAILGAAGEGDLGALFPDRDPRWKDAGSLGLLAEVMARVTPRWRIANVDCAIVLEEPRLAPYIEAMQAALSRVVAAPVAIKPKRAEGLGAIGRSEGIACFAVALVEER
jgi:2-C-methyl-D-erythritol 2,4-cyclodiphosphate synthase